MLITQRIHGCNKENEHRSHRLIAHVYKKKHAAFVVQNEVCRLRVVVFRYIYFSVFETCMEYTGYFRYVYRGINIFRC
jgi:hypothetical protein